MGDVDDCRADFERIRRETEALCAVSSLNPHIYGYQLQPGTRWNPGLSADEIDAYERALGVRFPASLRCMLSVMNGTDRPALNIYGSSGLQTEESAGVYAFPRDLGDVRERIAWVEEERAGITDVLADQGFELRGVDGLVPIYAHRYLLCRAGDEGTDAIIYGTGLLNYLRVEFLTPDRLGNFL
jgi:hypothetical protein